MARICTICSNPNRQSIDASIVSGAANRRLAAQFAVSEQAVRRHKSDHLPATMVKGFEGSEVSRGEDLVSQVEDLIAKTGRILEQAEESGDAKTALAAVRESRGNLELLGRLHGQLQAAQINVTAQATATGGWKEEGEKMLMDLRVFNLIIDRIAVRKANQKLFEAGHPELMMAEPIDDGPTQIEPTQIEPTQIEPTPPGAMGDQEGTESDPSPLPLGPPQPEAAEARERGEPREPF